MPEFDAGRLLLAGTGALSVALLPFWLNWLRELRPDVELRVVLTKSAHRFVAAEALSALSRSEVIVDDWAAQPPGRAVHVELAQWCETVVVYPATAHFLARFALGVVDTPLLLALQAVTGTIGIAPALPPGVAGSTAMKRHLDLITADPRVVLAPTGTARSTTTGREESGSLLPLPDLLARMRARSLRAGKGAA
ncbi:flavoprotein [Amycolatopsis suaedae]|uniref:Phosphopantothenoylcysteine decarboxylase n=1 Tax=Amycolatopsis suaedae TaxID=2510978 RepID=A0A4Q7J748_9PSEU|nr:flavoprotein [Amycolatopsis suaedae]RZQ62987.1 phosphopantothenoylcysteine decarboxylase [Amycolatopsis suaedae]